ncbi:MAG: HD domain-containing protein [Clostridia bacterium]|nr:HD domain-containing protein [Clostridia bacterium]
MIDIEKAKKEFIEYVKQYDINNGRIRLKMTHILKVAEVSRLIASNLNLSEEQINLAELIGIFHDIGRFEQIRLYDTFSDKDSGLDHAAYSVKVLYEDGLIKRFLDTTKYDYIIKQAVYNHNKAKIDESVEGEALIFSKIVRDADKVDIYRVINQDAMSDVFWYKEFENLEIGEQVFKEFKEDHFVKYKDVKNNADLIPVFYGYIFDFNFPYALKLIQKNEYLENFALRIKESFKSDIIDRKVEEILEICNNYMNKNT